MKTTICVILVLVFTQVGCGKVDDDSKASESGLSPAKTINAITMPSQLARPAEPPTKAYEGPLGLAMGITIDELVDDLKFKLHTGERTNIYSGSPPKPVPGFSSYSVTATKQLGVCTILALAEVDVVNDSGDQLKSETDRIAEMVELKYGKPTKKYDFASQDVYRRNPEFFMLALKKDAVTYAYSWVSKPGIAGFPNDLAEILVMASASQLNKGWVQLTYTFTNNKACNAEIKKQKSANL